MNIKIYFTCELHQQLKQLLSCDAFVLYIMPCLKAIMWVK